MPGQAGRVLTAQAMIVPQKRHADAAAAMIQRDKQADRKSHTVQQRRQRRINLPSRGKVQEGSGKLPHQTLDGINVIPDRRFASILLSR